MDKTILYYGQQVLVSQDVADFLEDDRRRQNAESRRDRRHRSKSDFETVLMSHKPSAAFGLDDIVADRLMRSRLQDVIHSLSESEQALIQLYFYEEQTMKVIGQTFGISKAAVSKRMTKLLSKMRGLL